MALGRKTGGRQKGTPNKMTANARSAIATAASALGGSDRLVEWAKESPDNEKAFWVQIYPKLVPVQSEISGPEGGPVNITAIEITPVASVKAAG
jgi:hypothetical protein